MSKKPDPYASEEETMALLKKDARSDSEKRLDALLEDRWANEQGVELEGKYNILRQIALDLLEQRKPVPPSAYESLILGAQLDGGIFVGVITQPDGTHSAVMLLPDRAKDLTWQAAKDWAANLNAQLPTRPMAALIFSNTQDRPQTGWHWTSEEVKEYASFAWFCGFFGGFQDSTRKSYEGSAVAVRLIHITA
jgi:hypothetical protein